MQLLFPCSLLITLSLLLPTPVISRKPEPATPIVKETIPFDFAWRFKLGDDGTVVQCPETTFIRNLSSMRCNGLRMVIAAKNPDDCRGTCCADAMCAIWQYSVTGGCWIGQTLDCVEENETWIGGERSIPAKPLPPSPNDPVASDYDDSDWELVDVPHDGIITGEYSSDETRGQAYLPKNVTWYRKHFSLPADWKGRSIWVYFEGVFRASTVYLNGQTLSYHDSGYTSFTVRLDNAPEVNYGDQENVLAVRASPSNYSGWWYEGGGIYRHVYLEAADRVHFVPDGIQVATVPTRNIAPHDPDDLTKGFSAETVVMVFRLNVTNDSPQFQFCPMRITVLNESGDAIAVVTVVSANVESGGIGTGFWLQSFSNIELWSPERPYLYTVKCEIVTTAKKPVVLETLNITIGVRAPKWDPDKGFFLNNVNYAWRGFNNHNNFAGVGMAIPNRINLFRVQSLRAVGGNSWRMSHNPPVPELLDILDALGIFVWDENRQFGDNLIWIEDQRSMARRDRNHPSVMTWSFCNEDGCNIEKELEEFIAKKFLVATQEADDYYTAGHVVSANMNRDFGNGLTSYLDVQGFSHQSGEVFDKFHEKFPKMPTIGSECCSCPTQRGEDFPNSATFLLGSFNGDCNEEQTRIQLDRSYVAGCMVWTLFDYYGEPAFGWPHVSSSFGSIDLAGFAKASAYWYRSWWLYSVMKNDSTGVPINPPKLINPDATPSEDNPRDGYLVHIVEHWEWNEQGEERTIHVYTNAPMAELIVNDNSQGVQKISWQGWAQWDVTFSPGELRANALTEDHSVVATHYVVTTGVPASIAAFVDVPNIDTGTGSALVLDGKDTGMISAALLDSNGRVSHSGSLNVSFSIASGPGRIIGVGNGNPACHEPNQVTWRSAYHGLARAIVQVTEDHTSVYRERLMEIDREGGKRTIIVDPRSSIAPPTNIVVQVSAPGVGSTTVTIPVTTDTDTHSVLSVAKRSLS